MNAETYLRIVYITKWSAYTWLRFIFPSSILRDGTTEICIRKREMRRKRKLGKINLILFVKITHQRVKACWIRFGNIRTWIVKQSKLMVLRLAPPWFKMMNLLRMTFITREKLLRTPKRCLLINLKDLNLLIQRLRWNGAS